ncbi:MAG: HTH domain-containing protein [Maricaulaceae bacterium]|nr:HTH domain-containing protein [Maricaulaceae bacterium]
MSRSQRLVGLVRALKDAAPKALTARELARDFQVSERTVYRDMARLAGMGLPIAGEAGLGYVLVPGDGPPPAPLTWPQAEAAWRGLRLLTHADSTEQALVAREAMRAFEAALGEERVRRLAAEPLLTTPDEPVPPAAVLDGLRKAKTAGGPARLTYVDLDAYEHTVTGRVTSVTLTGDHAVVAVQAEGENEPRLIRAGRIRKLTLSVTG